MALKFCGIPVVWMRLSNQITDEDMKLRRELSAWMSANDIYPAVNGGGGPNYKSEGYKPEDARKIIKWLNEHGAELDPSILTS